MANPLAQFFRTQLEGRFGITIQGVEDYEHLRETAQDYAAFRDEASELALTSLDYFSGHPQDLRPEARQRLAQRSRIALMVDPLAGAEGDLRSNFAFGRGVQMPEADDPAVQQVIEEAWTDSVNQEKLTCFEAQQHRSREMLSQANLLPAAYVKNGRVRVAFLDVDRCTHIICHPEDEERPLYYVYREKTRDGRQEWDYQNDRWKMNLTGVTDKPKVVYFKHWRNVEDAETEEAEGGAKIGDKPPKDKVNEGLVNHTRINRIGRTQWGTPPFARTLRFFSAMNELTEAHVAMAQARSTFIAKRTRMTGPEQLTNRANSILSQTGEISAGTFGEGTFGHGDSRDMPPPPGSFWMENQADKLESLNLSSGAGEMSQSAQIVRAPISAAAGFQQGYLGDAQNAGSLAAATALELPTLMNVQAWQETFEGLLRWFVDLVLREAVRAGRLGDNVGAATLDKTLAELNLQEAEGRAEAERRTGKSLSYRISSPYPGRRQLPEVQALVTGVMTAIPGGGRSEALVSKMLTFLLSQGMQDEDPKGSVEKIMEDLINVVWPMVDAQAQAQLDATLAAKATVPGQKPPTVKPGVPAPPGGKPSPKPGGKPVGDGSGQGEGKTSSGGALSEDDLDPVPSASALEEMWRLEVEEPVLARISRNGLG